METLGALRTEVKDFLDIDSNFNNTKSTESKPHSTAENTPSSELFSSESPYTDFHIHTSFFHFYKDFLDVEDLYNHRTDIAYLRAKYGTWNWVPSTENARAYLKGKAANIKKYSQSNFATLRNSPGSILCASIYPYEKQFALSGSKRIISNMVVSGIPLKRLKNIGTDFSWPMKEFLSEYAFLQAQNIQDPDGTFRIELARDNADLRRILSQANSSAQVLSIEGGHVLYGPIAGSVERVRSSSSLPEERQEILDNVELLRTLPHKVFFIVASHFTDNRIAGFSKTIDRPGPLRWLLTQLSKSKNLRGSFFNKNGEGIHGELDIGGYDCSDCSVQLPYTRKSPTWNATAPSLRTGIGREVLVELLRPDHGKSKRILIDVKHFDPQSRLEYYLLLDSLKESFGNIPIIAGHVAMSGEKLSVAMATAHNPLFDRYQEVKNPKSFYKDQAKKDSFWYCWTRSIDPSHRALFNYPGSPSSFNPFDGQIDQNSQGWFYPWGINLADEEVKIIYDSKGIIGLNFDERILGGYMSNYNEKYKRNTKEKFKNLGIISSSFAVNFEEYYRCEPLLRNVLYIVLKSERNDTTAWDHVAIGSDFDGLIDPINPCRTAAEIPSLHTKLDTYLEIFWKIHRDDPLFGNRDLFFGGSMSYPRAIQKLFFDNGRNFILTNF